MLLSKASDLGERRIIEILIKYMDKMSEMPIPFGDDISAVSIDDTHLAVLKTDMLVGKTDIPPGMTLWQAARKAVVMNISDLAAKGVKPIALLTALGLPRETSRNDIEEIAKGLNAGAREYGAYVIGGDTGEASDLIISCMAFGISMKNNLILRSGAKMGDILAVTGPFGRVSAGLKTLIDCLEVPSRMRERLLKEVYMPKARLKEGLVLAGSGVASASIDSSDGLAVSLHELKKMSNVGFNITKLPIAPDVEEFAKIFRFDLDELTLYGGEEYELILTIKPDRWEQAKKVVRQVSGSLIAIGEGTREMEILLHIDGMVKRIQYKGWEHFKT